MVCEFEGRLPLHNTYLEVFGRAWYTVDDYQHRMVDNYERLTNIYQAQMEEQAHIDVLFNNPIFEGAELVAEIVPIKDKRFVVPSDVNFGLTIGGLQMSTPIKLPGSHVAEVAGMEVQLIGRFIYDVIEVYEVCDPQTRISEKVDITCVSDVPPVPSSGSMRVFAELIEHAALKLKHKIAKQD